MLRSRASIRARDQRQLRRLFENLSRLKAERQVSLVELPAAAAAGKKRTPLRQKWSSVEQVRNDPGSADDPPIRVFEQVLNSTIFLRPQPGKATMKSSVTPTKQKTNIADAATGLDKVVSSTDGLKEEEIFLLRKLTTTMLWATNPNPRAAKEVFYWLTKLRPHPHLMKLLTPHAWEFLWALETETIPSSRSRLIGDLMVFGGVEMTEEQEIAYTGGLFWNNGRDQALERWEQLVKRTPSPAVWSLGIRMHSLEGNPEKAEEIVRKMIKKLGYAEHKMWIPVVMGYNHTYEGEKAWMAYEEMLGWAKKRGTRIKARQFDDLAMSFLDNYQPAMGLEVYKQMVYSANDESDLWQTETYQNLSDAVKAAQKATVEPEQLNELSLDALRNLPLEVADKYFYGGWMLNLMRMGRTDLAWYLVCDVMYARRFPPDSIHCNWIIQGFFAENNIEMGEKIAQEMINERLRHVQSRGADGQNRPRGITTALEPVPIDSVPIAPATVQTFSVLIQFNTRRKYMGRVLELCALMLECDIPPNSYIMNHLLYSLFRTHDMPKLAKTFQNMTTNGSVTPDLESFLVMWHAMWRHYTQTHRSVSEFMTPRQLFKLTLGNLPERTEEDAGMMKDVWYALIKCFFLARDLEGALVALQVGNKLWGMEIDSTVVSEVAFGVLRARPWDPKETGGARPEITGDTIVKSVQNLREMGRSIMLSRARRRRGGPGVVHRKRKINIDLEGNLESLTALLLRELGSSALVHDDLQRARIDMGLKQGQLENLP